LINVFFGVQDGKGRRFLNVVTPKQSFEESMERGSYPPHPALSPGGARESSNPAASCRDSFGLKVEIRIETKNGIEDIIKQKRGRTDRGKKVPKNRIFGANR
jgi:hypothetical protein